MIANQDSLQNEVEKLESKIKDMSKQEMKELLLITGYKLALVRSQVEALTEVMIKNKVTTFEEVWKKTNENFKRVNM